MQFQSDAQKACYDKVLPWMKEIFGDFAIPRDEAPAVGVMVGSALAEAWIMPWGEDDATICTRSWVVCGAEMTPDLMKYLLLKNNEMRFGAFGIDQEDDIFFEHTIVGSTCDKAELKASVMAVVVTADRFDDEITGRWGGERAVDRIKR